MFKKIVNSHTISLLIVHSCSLKCYKLHKNGCQIKLAAKSKRITKEKSKF